MSRPDGTPPPPPEAQLISVARQARNLSPEEAAQLPSAGVGPSRWRHIERGYQTKDKKVRAPDATLARMAYTVGVPPDQLEEVGRGKAADILREILRQESAPAPSPSPYADLSDENEALIWGMQLPEEKRRRLIDALRAGKCNEEDSDGRRAV